MDGYYRQLNGKYFFNGMSNLSAGELAFWIVVDEAQKQLGVEDIFALALIIGGIPNLNPDLQFSHLFSMLAIRIAVF
ncbi:hypothetical protein SPM24T3_23412 [Serratia sp. M24T3]|nr:hypothetical protein [Serratia sp. M24T3]EIC82144.1 hypothetical protein SPM24T3_23412 [Serratia sp. M24T3]